MPDSCQVILDLLGSDTAPKPEIEAVRLFLSLQDDEFKDVVILAVGDSSSLSMLPSSNRIEKIESTKGVPMNVSPSFALRNYGDSSMGKGIKLLSEGKGDVFVSAGNTGAVLAFSLKHLKIIEGIRRPGILVILPDKLNNRILIDAGANAECRPEHLLGFANLGLSVAEKLLKKKDPSVGLLNIGTEESKGDQLRKMTYSELEKLGKKFYGNVEPHDIFSSPVDVIVTDGFTGNIVLKTLEGSFEFISSLLKRTLNGGNIFEKFGALVIKRRITSAFSEFKYQQYGAALLAGLSAPVLIAHGRSDSQALLNALKYASRIARANPFSSYASQENDNQKGDAIRGTKEKGTLF